MTLAQLIQNLKNGQLTSVKNELTRFGQVISQDNDVADRDQILAGMHHSFRIAHLDATFVVNMHNGNIINIIHVGHDTYANHHYNKLLA